jgi:hypothetical protein
MHVKGGGFGTIARMVLEGGSTKGVSSRRYVLGPNRRTRGNPQTENGIRYRRHHDPTLAARTVGDHAHVGRRPAAAIVIDR